MEQKKMCWKLHLPSLRHNILRQFILLHQQQFNFHQLTVALHRCAPLNGFVGLMRFALKTRFCA